jgi:hypothetical protein
MIPTTNRNPQNNRNNQLQSAENSQQLTAIRRTIPTTKCNPQNNPNNQMQSVEQSQQPTGHHNP